VSRKLQDKYCILYLLWLSASIVLLSSCNTTKFLPSQATLLKDNTIILEDKDNIPNPLTVKASLLEVLKQKPNTRYLGIKREWLYLKAEQRKGNFWLKKWMLKNGEEPVVLDTALIEQSAQSVKNYLFNRGYFNAEVSFDVVYERKRAYATYFIKAGKAYIIDELNYISSDPGITSLLDSLEFTSILSIGDVIDDSKYQLEKARITNAFLNKGYADFYSNLISPLQVDTTGSGILVTLEIYSPEGGAHQLREVGRIKIFTDFEPGRRVPDNRDTIIKRAQFYFPEHGSSVDPKVILEKVFLKEGTLTSRKALDNTYRGLGDLGVYKFTSITPVRDPADPNIINYNIQLTPNERWVFDTGLDFNYSTLQSEGFGRNLFGVTGSVRLENRNLFKKAISLRLTAEIGAEVNLAQIDSFNTFSTNLEAVISIPRFYGLPGTLKFISLIKLGNKPLMNPNFYSTMINRSATQLAAQYQNVFVTDFYQYQQFNLSYGYDVPATNRKKYTIHTFGINYYRPDTLNQFGEITRNAEFILRSFLGDRLFTGFIYRDFNFYYQSKVSSRGNYWIFNMTNEVSGFEIWAVNSLYNSITNKTGTFRLKLDKEIDFARYTQFDFQFRYYLQLPRNQTIAFRFNPGIVFSLDSLSVPFVKQFSVGGPQSIRAWQIRQLGPGSNPVVEASGGQPYFSTGDLKLEMNLEYRFDLFWRLKSAIFLDMGNVWLLDSNTSIENFSSNWYKQLAIGTGLGLRLDLSFVLFRLDMGYKLKNPFKDEVSGSYWYHNSSNPFNYDNFKKNWNFNLAIGYPF
jgi:outer membrane protein assembly factor BamA